MQFFNSYFTTARISKMKYSKFVSSDDIDALDFEVVSQDLKVFLTRELDSKLVSYVEVDESPENKIILQNIIVNESRNIAGLSIHVLESDLDGFYHPADQAWHNGEFQLALRRLNTVQFIEAVGELIE